MGTVVHGACSSPRQQHHQCELTSGPSACLAGGNQHPHPHQANTPIYSSISKYLRPHTAPQMQQMQQMHTHPHIYDGSSSNAAANVTQLQYGTTLNQISYIPMGTVVSSHPSPTTVQHGYNSAQLSCASPIVPSAADTYRNYWAHTHASTLTYGTVNGRANSKRKTAVQLLAETKPFYMKTDASAIDRMPVAAPPSPGYRKNFLPNSSLKRGRNSAPAGTRDQSQYGTSLYGGASLVHGGGEPERRFLPRPPISRDMPGQHGVHNHHHHHRSHHHHAQLNRHSAPSYNNNALQTKLKLLLTPESCRDRLPMSGHVPDHPRSFDFSPSIVAENCSGESSLPYMRKDEIVAIPPPMFLSAQSYDDSYTYAGGDSSSIDDPLVLTDDYRPISPPAEYAAETPYTNADVRCRYNYQRSYSHSHEMTGDNAKYDVDTFNINSHKSLPDLHSQISRHSPHSEILSCCSRGNRSNKSAGESSLNRDSGGSSGHYTHRSEPCYRQREAERESYDTGKPVCCNHTGNAGPVEIRRDSGSSTQHSANSYCGYASPATYGRTAAECIACRCSSRNAAQYDTSGDYLLNFPTPVVPEAFQDDYTPPSPSVLLSQSQGSQTRLKSNEQRYYSSSTGGELRQQQQQQQQHQHQHPHQHQHQQQQQSYTQISTVHSAVRLQPNSCTAQSPGSTPSMEDISPPPIEFKRQKCIRLKNRNRLPVPNMMAMCNNSGTINGSVSSSTAYDQLPETQMQSQGHAQAQAQAHSQAQAFLFPKCISTNSANSNTNTNTNTNTNSEDYSRVKSFGNSSSRRSSCDRANMTSNSGATLPPIPGSGPTEIDQAYANYNNYIRETDELSDLENFFDRMGLNDEKFNELYTTPRRRRSTATDSDDSSTVFFSDVSTVDSMRLPDSTETQPQTQQPYRPSEPPSIVERNARIIKWLCNIRKLELN